MGTKDGSIIATIITIHMPRNDAAAARHAWRHRFFVGLPQCSLWLSLAVVLVMAAPPEPRLVAPLGRAVEPLVHAPEAVHPALVRGVGVIDNPILQHERAHTWPFLPVRRPVCSNARSELGDEGIILA